MSPEAIQNEIECIFPDNESLRIVGEIRNWLSHWKGAQVILPPSLQNIRQVNLKSIGLKWPRFKLLGVLMQEAGGHFYYPGQISPKDLSSLGHIRLSDMRARIRHENNGRLLPNGRILTGLKDDTIHLSGSVYEVVGNELIPIQNEIHFAGRVEEMVQI